MPFIDLNALTGRGNSNNQNPVAPVPVPASTPVSTTAPVDPAQDGVMQVVQPGGIREVQGPAFDQSGMSSLAKLSDATANAQREPAADLPPLPASAPNGDVAKPALPPISASTPVVTQTQTATAPVTNSEATPATPDLDAAIAAARAQPAADMSVPTPAPQPVANPVTTPVVPELVPTATPKPLPSLAETLAKAEANPVLDANKDLANLALTPKTPSTPVNMVDLNNDGAVVTATPATNEVEMVLGTENKDVSQSAAEKSTETATENRETKQPDVVDWAKLGEAKPVTQTTTATDSKLAPNTPAPATIEAPKPAISPSLLNASLADEADNLVAIKPVPELISKADMGNKDAIIERPFAPLKPWPPQSNLPPLPVKNAEAEKVQLQAVPAVAATPVDAGSEPKQDRVSFSPRNQMPPRQGDRPTFGSKSTNPAPAAPAVTAPTNQPTQVNKPNSNDLPRFNAFQKSADAPKTAPVTPTAPANNQTASANLAPLNAANSTAALDKPQQVKNIEQPGGLQTKKYSLQDLLAQAVRMGASDLHLTVGYRAIARVDGKLMDVQSQQLENADVRQMMEEVVAGHKLANLDKDSDLDLSYELTKPQARFRVNIFRQRGNLSAVFRVIPDKIRTPEELNLPPLIKELTSINQGLVLVTGPTGSGKTTTLASLINQINLTEPRHIITIEDPVEYIYPKGIGLIDQRAVYVDTENWRTALRSALRQDPDVVMVGEMRDVETMESALQVAETGHLVFSTLHTNSASQTIDRIIDAFPDDKQSQVRTQLATVLMAVISQRLVPIPGGGRRVVVELMVVTSAIRNAIRDKKVYQIDNMIQTSAELGMITLEKSLVGLVREGVISVDVAQAYANKPDDILSMLGRNY